MSSRKLLFGLVTLGSLLTPPACKTPTEVTVEIGADLAYRSDMKIAVQVDREDRVVATPPRLITESAWPAGGTVGTVVLLPSGDDEMVVMRVVLATAREPSMCTATDSAGCIVTRRRIRFAQGESLRTRVVLRPACLGVFCDEATSCAADGSCGSLESDAFGDGGTSDGPVLTDAGDPYVNAVLADRPRHYYRLDEPVGATVAKDTMGRADGTYAGVKLGATGSLLVSPNTGAFFDGSSSVTIPNVDDLPGAFSIELWARADSSDEPLPTIAERIDQVGGSTFGYRMTKPPGTTASFDVFRGADTFNATVAANKFAGYSHLVAVVRGGELEMWLDGKRAATSDVAGATPSAVVGPFVLGGSRIGGNPFKGTIDEVAIYDYPLDEEQIRRHYDIAEQESQP